MVAFVFLLISSFIIGLFIGLSDPFMTNEGEDDAFSSVFQTKGNVLILRKPFLSILLDCTFFDFDILLKLSFGFELPQFFPLMQSKCLGQN